MSRATVAIPCCFPSSHVPSPNPRDVFPRDAGALRIASELPHASTLMRELQEMHRKVSAAGHDSYGVWRDGENDDLGLALAIALWQAERVR